MIDHYEELLEKQKIVKDRVRGVVHRESNGFYLYGRPGTSKTYTVRTTLDTLAVPYTVHNGHLTEIGLFDLLHANRDRIIVLDDVTALFNKPIALQLLMAALGNPHDGSRTRYVCYKTAKGDVSVPFTGAIIGISNLPLKGHHNEILAAIRDRVYCLNYEPTEDQIKALINKIAEQGFPGVEPTEAKMVANYLLEECALREVQPSVRLFVDKAIPDFRLFKAGNTETHWRDLVASSVDEQLVELQFETKDLSRAEQTEAERRIVLDLCLGFPTRAERLAEWERRTGKSRAAYDRRLAELKKGGKLKDGVNGTEGTGACDPKDQGDINGVVVEQMTCERIERVGSDGKKRVDYRTVKEPKPGECYWIKEDVDGKLRWVQRRYQG